MSCLEDTDPENCILAPTPYVVMRVGTTKPVPYVKPGDPNAGALIADLKGAGAAVLLADHGPVVSGKDLFFGVLRRGRIGRNRQVSHGDTGVKKRASCQKQLLPN